MASAPMDEETKANLEVLKALNKAIEAGPWEHSLFFQGIGKKLRDLRDRFQQELGLDELATAAKASSANADQGKYIQVYISLYQAEGANLQKWGMVVNSLAGHNLTRPVYKNEEDIQSMIRAKNYKVNDAYIAVRVRVEDLYQTPGDAPLVDRFGRELLMLKENVLRLENIAYFVHLSGHYLLNDGILVRQGNLQ